MDKKYYKIADITVEVRSDLPITENTFHPKFKQFESNGPADEMTVIHHHFNGIPEVPVDRKNPLYLRPPWAIFEHKDQIIYEWITPQRPFKNIGKKVISDKPHSHLEIFHDDSGEKKYHGGALESLAMFPTDQIWLAQKLSHLSGCIIHSLGVILDGNGYLFVGHSNAGKSTMAEILMKEAVILCDDRNIIRKVGDKFNVYGTWSHGDVPVVSASSAPLRGIYFLKQSKHTRLLPIQENSAVIKTLLACLIRPLGSKEWWHRSMLFLNDVSKAIPCRTLEFNKSGDVLNILQENNPQEPQQQP